MFCNTKMQQIISITQSTNLNKIHLGLDGVLAVRSLANSNQSLFLLSNAPWKLWNHFNRKLRFEIEKQTDDHFEISSNLTKT